VVVELETDLTAKQIKALVTWPIEGVEMASVFDLDVAQVPHADRHLRLVLAMERTEFTSCPQVD
jgi:hypothetical protein